ncbi:CsbD family protein [Marinobacter zhanjiangensis]|uniref:CsbD-like domain-containing protein n=1 Tax=Marinobacter zhanjiangensis TaxID=578215 RepID=A0ABQ3AT30_9GAMM|nr:CsbD family protein [Marinobacter zhanjiangensis]GGY65942.1 hypothetical protein GCM10007071_10900 [Marinobacter zhanjiangensis]
MNSKQVEGRADEAKGKVKEVAGKASGDKKTEYKGKTEKHGGKAETVLADVNDDAEKHDGSNGDDRKRGNKDDTVLGELNDDDSKDKR